MFADSARTLRAFAAGAVILGGLIVASCGGGGSSSGNGQVVPPTNAPATTQNIPAGGGTLTLPAAANGQAPKLTFGAGIPAGTTITASTSSQAPANAPAPSLVARRAQALTGAVDILYIEFSFSNDVSSTTILSENVNLTNADPTSASYYVELDDTTSSPATKLGFSGPGTILSGLLTIVNGGFSPQTLQAGHTYVLQIYYVPAGTATPTPPAAVANACSAGAEPISTSAPFAPGTVTFTSPTVGGCTATVAVAGVTSSGTASLTMQLTAPAGLASPPSTGGTVPFTPVAYFSATYNNAFAISSAAIPAISVTLPSVASGVNFYVAQWVQAPGGASTFTGYLTSCSSTAPLQLTANGNTVSLAAQPCGGPAVNYAAGTTSTFALVQVTAGTALPTGVACTSGAAPVSTSAPFAAGTVTFALPASGGCSGSIALTSITTSGTAAITSQVTAPNALATPPGNQVFVGAAFFSITYNNAFTQSDDWQPAISIAVPSIAVGSRNFYVAEWSSPSGGPSQFLGYVSDCSGNPAPMTVSGNVLSLAALPCTGAAHGTTPAGTTVTYGLVYNPAGTNLSSIYPPLRMTSIAMSGRNSVQLGQ